MLLSLKAIGKQSIKQPLKNMVSTFSLMLLEEVQLLNSSFLACYLIHGSMYMATFRLSLSK